MGLGIEGLRLTWLFGKLPYGPCHSSDLLTNSVFYATPELVELYWQLFLFSLGFEE